ncbi:hypothetical protein [Pseudonocardia xishanensis]|uniref:Uncharacterized protein n=1 Tax=Pseudonocardia xishanensis TaxID=630995 RepID=A0ABP8S333_9PSEU
MDEEAVRHPGVREPGRREPAQHLVVEGAGRVSSRRGSPKSAHLATIPYASCSYRDARQDVAVAECHAAWDPDPARSRHLFAEPEPPLGFDPAAMFAGGLESPDAGIVVLRPWRLRWAEASDMAAGGGPVVWTPSDAPVGR